MDITDLTFKLVLLFFPGILSSLLLRKFTKYKSYTGIELGLYSLIFGLCSYMIFQLCVEFYSFLSKVASFLPDFESQNSKFWQSIQNKELLSIDAVELILVSFIGLLLPILYLKLLNSKIFAKVIEWMDITEKISEESGIDYFLSEDSTEDIQIWDFKNKIMYYGTRSGYYVNDTNLNVILTGGVIIRTFDKLVEETPFDKVDELLIVLPLNSEILITNPKKKL